MGQALSFIHGAWAFPIFQQFLYLEVFSFRNLFACSNSKKGSMIEQITPTLCATMTHESVPAEPVPHSVNLQATLQSVFQFEESFPEDCTHIDPTTITYINYRALLEMVRSTCATLQSEVLAMEPAGLKDALLVNQLALSHVQFQWNLLDTRLDHLQDYLQSQASWLHHVKWTRTHNAHQRFQKLKAEHQKMTRIFKHLQHAYWHLRHTIRASALAIVKSQLPSTEKQHITQIEALESARKVLWDLLQEIENQLDLAYKKRRVVYYMADRQRIYNKMHSMNLILNSLLSQLEKVNLDSSALAPEWLRALYFRKKTWRWYVSDKYVFRTLCQHQPPLQHCLETLDSLLQPESHKLNVYANEVTSLGFLLQFAPMDSPSDSSKSDPPAPEVSASLENPDPPENIVASPYFPQEEDSTPPKNTEPVLTLQPEEIEEPVKPFENL